MQDSNTSKASDEAQDIEQIKESKPGLFLQVQYDENGVAVSQNGKKIGRPKKVELPKLSKVELRELYNRAFDENAPELFSILFEQAKSDKDLLKFAIEQRIGKAAQVVSGDEQSPLTVVVRRGITDRL